jgi:transcriptional regulator with XRE-family HTH domain
MKRSTAQSLQMRFGMRIKRLRQSRGWSFTYLAVVSGLAKNTVVEVESGRTEARLKRSLPSLEHSTRPWENSCVVCE